MKITELLNQTFEWFPRYSENSLGFAMGFFKKQLFRFGVFPTNNFSFRLEEAVLSAVSMQIQVIQAALKQKQSSLELMDRQVDLDQNSGIFITLNPAGKGYGGRQKLPDNLKQLFRPVAMSRPDNELISEVLLFTEGYQNASVLGRKLFAVFSLSK